MRAQLALARLLLLALTTTAVTGQETPAEGEGGPFVDTVDVNVVNIEVYVTDKKGRRIVGLTRDDFELTVDRRPMAISYFYAVEGGEEVTGDDDGLGVRTVERQLQIPGPRSRPVPQDQRLRLIVFIDNFNIRPFNRNRAIAATRSFLRTRLRPGDEVMLVSYKRSLKLRHNFTSDTNLIAEALFDLEGETGHGTTQDTERNALMRKIYNATDIAQVRGRVTQQAQSIRNDIKLTLKALNDHVESLAGLPGRKAVLYVSDGLPMRAGADLYEALAEHFPDETGIRIDLYRFDMTRQFQGLTQRANANRVTFYTLDAAGLRTFTYLDAANAHLSGSVNIDQAHFSNLQQSLRMMADETGGLAILGTNDFGPLLNRVADDFDSYYSLGFTPVGEAVGRYHKVQVRLKDDRKGVVLRYREGYRNKPPATRMNDKVVAALRYGAVSNPLGVEVVTGQAVRQDKDEFHTSFVVKIPIGKLSLLPQGDLYRGRVRLFVGVKDDKGRLAPMHQQVEEIDIPSAEFDKAQQQAYHLEITLIMRSGRQLVAVGVLDEIGATEGVAMRGVNLGG